MDIGQRDERDQHLTKVGCHKSGFNPVPPPPRKTKNRKRKKKKKKRKKKKQKKKKKKCSSPSSCFRVNEVTSS